MQTDDDDKRHTGQPENYVAGHLITPSVDFAPETNWKYRRRVFRDPIVPTIFGTVSLMLSPLTFLSFEHVIRTRFDIRSSAAEKSV